MYKRVDEQINEDINLLVVKNSHRQCQANKDGLLTGKIHLQMNKVNCSGFRSTLYFLLSVTNTVSLTNTFLSLLK